MPLEIDYDPRLTEAVVLAELARREANGQLAMSEGYRGEAAALYALPAGEARDQGFARVHLARWLRLGLGRAIVAALADVPEVERAVGRAYVLLAAVPRDEEVDLVPGPSAASRAVRIRLEPRRFARPAELHQHLRRELRHVADLCDPAFGFVHQDRLAPRPSEDALVRDRYRALWRTSVAGRLARDGWLPQDERPRLETELDTLYRTLPERARRAIFARLFDGARPDHPTLIACARDTRALLALAGEDPTLGDGPVPGGLCPLCEFPSHAWHAAPLEPAVVEAIAKDFPRWHADRGICERCADIYELRYAAGAWAQ